MKRIISAILVLGVVLIFTGCATICPKQTVVETVWTPFGPMTIQIERDTFCEERHSEERFIEGNGWLTLEEYEALVKKYKQKSEQPKDTI